MRTFDEVPDGEEIAVSATLYVTYRRCPQQALARLRGVYPPPSKAAFKGALTHRLIARHLEGGPIDDGRIEHVCREETGANLNHQMNEIGITTMTEFRAVVNEVAELYRRFAAIPTEPALGTEISFEVPVGGGVTLRGRMDALFEDPDGTRIVDWKTGPNLGDDVDAQLGFYALAWQREHGSPPARTDAVSVATGERRVGAPTAATLADTEHEVAGMVDSLRAALSSGHDLPRTAGPYCRWCPVLEDCDEGSSAIALLD